MQEAARVWLHCPANSRATGFGTVAELYLLHVLVPLGHTDEAVELIAGEVGSNAFTEDQRQTALDVVEEKQRQNLEHPLNPGNSPNSETTVSSQGLILQFSSYEINYRKVQMMNKESLCDCVCVLQELLPINFKPCSGLSTESCSAPARSPCGESSWLPSFFICFFFVWIQVRLNVLCSSVSPHGLLKYKTFNWKSLCSFPAALPSSFIWISKLLQLLRQMWRAMFAPYYQALTQSKEL